MQFTIFDTKGLNTFLYTACSLFIKLIGWKGEGKTPDLQKFVFIAAPHTSNFDLPLLLIFAFKFRINIFWMGKKQIFKKPFTGIMKWLGGIPVERSKSTNLVQQSIDLFNKNDKFVMVVPPEGTRKKVNYWKTGFYYIAHGAGVPIVLCYLDYKRKAGGIGPTIMPTGDLEKDMKKIKDFYKTITGRFPEKTSKD